MPLAPGTTIGSYRILSPIGAGGMGEVYRAEHVRLGREVAVKVLPDAMAGTPDRRDRFEREARLLGTLNHPNIATLHGVEDSGELMLLEMELVAGETMAERLKRGPMPPQEAIPIFKQIAEALEAAHAHGIIHRDLKPANVKITPEGRVKVLDFGLAKALVTEAGSGDSPASPTFTTRTHDGLVFGTAAYMSPEQVRGRGLDRRTDIWSFGCMLFEALAGRAPFAAETTSDTLAAVLKEEPDWRALPPAPVSLARLVRRCLRKDPQARLHDIADARLELEEALNESAALVLPVPGRRAWRLSRRSLLVGGTAALLALAAILGAFQLGQRQRPVPVQSRFVVPLPAGYILEHGPGPALAVAPDGRRLVFVGLQRGGGTQLFSRPLAEFEAAPLPHTEGATAPFFSPDGRWIGFYANGALHRVAVDGGTPLRIGEVPAVWSATWTADDWIVFAAAEPPHGLRRIPADGGAAEELTTARSEHGELQHAFPQALPGDRRLLFSILTTDGWQPALLELATREWRTVGRGAPGATPAHFAATGHLVYAVSTGALVAAPFDPARGSTTGSPVALPERVQMGRGGSSFALSSTGMLVYLPARTELPRRSLVSVDRDGRAQLLSPVRGPYAHPRLAADGRLLTYALETESGADVWTLDVQRGARTRLTNGGVNGFPLWTPDGAQITYQAAAGPGRFSLFTHRLTAGGPPEPLLADAPPGSGGLPAGMAGLLPGTMPRPGSGNPHLPMSWSPDGQHLAFEERKPGAQRDIWVLPRGGDPLPFVLTPFDEWAPAFSPDGQWLAYVSNESGRHEIYVQPYPGPGAKWPISTDGGTEPAWSPDGRELFYRRGDQMLAVPIATAPQFTAGAGRVLFEGAYDALEGARNYDISPDGRQFVMVRSDPAEPRQRLYVAANWFEALESRAAEQQR